MTATETTVHQSIDPATTMGLVAVTVADLERSLTFYTRAIGLAVLDRQHGVANLGVDGRPLLRLTEQPGASPWTERSTGLYHFAILLPTAADLGRWIRNWFALGLPMFGQGDHLVSQALYLRDPDGHGIEMYRDRPRGEWIFDHGRLRMASDPVDIRGLVEEADRSGISWSGAPSGTIMGHVHLQVRDIPEARHFYCEILGFDEMAAMPTALFVSAGGYHHHLGANVWHSHGSAPAGAGVAAMQFFTITMPSDSARKAVFARLAAAGYDISHSGPTAIVTDPSGIQIHLVSGA